MNTQQIEEFINHLSSDTLSNKTNWRYLTELETVEPESNQELSTLLFQNEYRTIQYRESYYASLQQGTIYLLHETTESGRDGTIIKCYHMYIQNSDSESIAEVHIEQGYIYQLVQCVQRNLLNNDKSHVEVERFISNVLNT